jgi:hypothetical protein
MIRFANRVLAAAGVGVFAVALTITGVGSAGAAPASGEVDSIQDLKGSWLTSLAGYQEGQDVTWQHLMTVRKVKGSAAVAWEAWRDCADHPRECKAGEANGDGWSAPSRVLLAMDAAGIVHGVGATGSMTLTPGEDGMSAVMLSAGQRDNWTAMPDPTAMNRQGKTTTPVFGPIYLAPSGAYAAAGPSSPSNGTVTVNPTTGGFTFTPVQN